jgi:probable phosphoglycerate mutase
VALPDDLQLRRCLPARHQHHEGDPRGLERGRGAATVIDRVLIRADGAARGNPGPAAAGAVLIDASLRGADRPDAPAIALISRPLGIQTNNYAEYTGVILALEKALELGAREVELVLDSMLIVEQLSGRWKVKHPAIRPLAARAMELLRRFDRWSLRHERRENNVQADALANLALDDPRAAAEAEARGAA